jgi:hypothetical protein
LQLFIPAKMAPFLPGPNIRLETDAGRKKRDGFFIKRLRRHADLLSIRPTPYKTIAVEL